MSTTVALNIYYPNSDPSDVTVAKLAEPDLFDDVWKSEIEIVI